jgi:rare lipoprotein A (peptidoglycan hydrolase)
MRHHTTIHSHLRTAALRSLAGLAALLVLLVGAASSQAATSSHVSWAPHLQRKIVPTRAIAHGTQIATWYGPGFYGHRLACGGTLRETTYGIAHRTLPCGTLVTLGYHGRRVSVRVVDRGPFSGASVDLTERTKRYLHFTSGSVRMTEVKRFRILPQLHHVRH